MKIKRLIEKLEKCNPEAEVVGNTSDHCYNHYLDVHKGFAYVDKFEQWVSVGSGTERKIPIVQLEFY